MNNDPKSISVGTRIAFWAAAWLVAAAATLVPSSGVYKSYALVYYCWLFPVGLLGLFVPSDWQPPVPAVLILSLGWLLYFGLSVYGLTRRERPRYFLVYVILIVLLILNVAGCRVQVSQPPR